MFEMQYDKNGDPKRPNVKGSEPKPQINPLPTEEQPNKALEVLSEEPEAQTEEVATEGNEESSAPPVAVAEAKPQPIQPDPKQSFKELRAQKDKAERERDFLLQRLQEVEQARVLATKPVPQQQAAEEDLDIAIGPDDLAEGKHLSKVQKKIKQLETQIAQFHQQTATISVEAKLKAQYPDFDSVVTKDNVDMLRSSYPELAQTINSSNDLYSKAVSAYTLIRKLGIQPDAAPYLEDVQKAVKNSAKPRPVASISPQQGESPLTRANAFAGGLTDELKAQLLKEMNMSRRDH